MSYRAFFSYARADDALANWLHRQLDSYRTPASLLGVDGALGLVPSKLHPIFRDRTDLQAGGHIDQSLEDALALSECLIVLCTPTSAKSKWVNHECEVFLRLGKEARIFPVIGAGEPDSADPETECLPPALQGKGLVAADLREIRLPTGQLVGDGRDGGRLKLLAGLLGVPLDALVGRERRRQRLLMSGLAAAAATFLVVAAVAIVQSFAASNSARIAREQRADAVLSLGRVAIEQGWQRLEAGDVRGAARIALAGRAFAPELIEEQRALLAAALYEQDAPETLATFASYDSPVIIRVSDDAARVLFFQVTNWGSASLNYLDVRTSTMLHYSDNVPLCNELTAPVRYDLGDSEYVIEPCTLGERRDRPTDSRVTAVGENQQYRVRGRSSGWVDLLDRRTGAVVFQRQVHQGPVTFVQPLESGVVSFGEDRRLMLWRPTASRRTAVLATPGDTDFVWGGHVSWSADGRSVLHMSSAGPSVFDVANERLTTTADVPFDTSVAMFIPESTLAAILTDDDIRLWDAERRAMARQQLAQNRGGWLLAAHDGTGRYLAAASNEVVRVWSLGASNAVSREIRVASPPTALAVLNDGALLIGFADGAVRFSARGSELTLIREGAGARVTALGWHEETRRLAIAGSDGAVAIWSIDEPRAIRTWRAHDGLVSVVRFSPSGEALATGGEDTRVRLWSTSTWRGLAEINPETSMNGGVPWLSFSPDGAAIAISLNDNSAEVWDVAPLFADFDTLKRAACETLLIGEARAFSESELSAAAYLTEFFLSNGRANDVCR